MVMGFVGRFRQALHVCAGARSNESVHILPVLGTSFVILQLKGGNIVGYARIAFLLPDLERYLSREHTLARYAWDHPVIWFGVEK